MQWWSMTHRRPCWRGRSRSTTPSTVKPTIVGSFRKKGIRKPAKGDFAVGGNVGSDGRFGWPATEAAGRDQAPV